MVFNFTLAEEHFRRHNIQKCIHSFICITIVLYIFLIYIPRAADLAMSALCRNSSLLPRFSILKGKTCKIK